MEFWITFIFYKTVIFEKSSYILIWVHKQIRESVVHTQIRESEISRILPPISDLPHDPMTFQQPELHGNYAPTS